MDESTIHQLVVRHGRDQARQMVAPELRSLVDIAAEVLADESRAIGISYSGFCLTSLPHKRLADGEAWKKSGHKVTLLVEPGRMLVNGNVKMFGVPYGARARMILLYLQTQAIRTGSREVELGRSMRSWLERMGLAWGGETARALRDQAARISACSLKFFWETDVDANRANGWAAARIVNSGLEFAAPTREADGQGRLWEDRVVLDQAFFDALRSHPVPLREASLRLLRDRSLALDTYIWLAWRLHTLEKRTPIRWAALYQQFGAGFATSWHFKPRFKEALQTALAAYPEAKVDIETEGVLLHPSAPPVPKLRVA